MNTTSAVPKNFPKKNTIWSLVDKGDFKSVIDVLLKAGIPDHNMGEQLFAYGDQAITENKFHTAIAIFIFITQALEDQSEAVSLFKKIGDIYTLISEHTKAREYYGKLPFTLESIRLCFQTYIPTVDIAGLLSFRDMVLSRIPETNHGQIHTLIDDIIMKIVTDPEIFNSHFNFYNKNIARLRTIPPFTIDSKKLDYDWSSQTAKFWKPEILRLSNTIYIKQDKVWQKKIPVPQKNVKKTKLGAGSNIMVYCDSSESFFDFVNRVQTNTPEFIKFECRIIIDFNLLKLILAVFDLSPLTNCDFIIRFIDKNKLKSQLIDLLLEKKFPFSNRIVYLSQNDPNFFSKHVIPTLKECERKMLHNVEQYEKQLLKIFPENYQTTVIQKIETGQKLNILFFTSRFTTYLQYSTRSIAEGFRQLGHEIFIEIEDKDSGATIRKDVCMENLINFKPDIIFAIDHLRYSYPWIPKSIPFVSWIQDLLPHLMTLDEPSLITANDHIFSFSQYWIDNFFKSHTVLKNKEVYCLPVTVDHNIYYPLYPCEKKYDITFITHLPDPDLTLLPILNGKMIPEINSDSALLFLKKLIDGLNKVSMVQLHQILVHKKTRKKLANKICQKLNIPFTETLFKLTELHDDNKVVSRFTHHALLLLKTKPILALIENKIEVRVFGKNWEKLPKFKKIALGIAKNGTELNQIINESRINLNLSPGTSYHMKAPEVIATNTFMLTRRISKQYDLMPITNFFKEEKEIILFEDEFDLIKKTIFFLNNKKQRETIANLAYHKYIANYGVEKAVRTILNKLGNSKI